MTAGYLAPKDAVTIAGDVEEQRVPKEVRSSRAVFSGHENIGHCDTAGRMACPQV